MTSNGEVKDMMGASVRSAKAAFTHIEKELLIKFIEGQPDVKGSVDIEDIQYPSEGAGSTNGIGIFDAVLDRGTGRRKCPMVVRYLPGFLALSQKSYADEFRTLRVVKEEGLPVPDVYWLDEHGEALGTPAYLMERIEGEIPSASMYSAGPLANISDEKRKEMMLQAAEFHGRLRKAAIGPDKVSHLLNRGPKEAGIARELGWWLHEARNTSPDDPKLAELTSMYDWLVANQPLDLYPPNLVHGDSQIANLIFRDGKLAAAIDWEVAYIGHNEADIGLLVFLTESQKIFDKAVDGTPTEAEYLLRYEEASGTKAMHYPYFNFFIMFKVMAAVFINLKHMPAPDQIWAIHKDFVDKAWDRARKYQTAR